MVGTNTGRAVPARASGVVDRLREGSGTVAVVVVAAVVLVAAGAGVAFVLTGSDDGGDGPPDAELRLDVTAESVAVVHESGERVDPDEIQVTILAGGERTELGLSEFDEQPDDPEQFGPDEQFAQTGDTYTGNVTVFVLHEQTDTRLADETVTVDGGQDTNGGSDGFASVGIERILAGDGGDLFVGDDVTVEFSLTAGEESAESAVTVTLDGETVLDETVAAEPGATVTETVTAGADLGDGLDVAVETGGRSATESLAAPSLGVELVEEPTASPADVGYVVENTGEIGDERPVTVTATAPDGSVLGETSRSERVAGGETVTGTIGGVDLAPGGDLTLSAGAETATVALGESEFQIVDLDLPGSVTPGEPFTGEYVVENAGSFTDTQNITASLDGTTQTRRLDVTLGPGEQTSNVLSFDPGLNITSGVSVEVSTADDTFETELNVTPPADGVFAVSIDETSAPVAPGEELLVTSTVENVGGATETTQVFLAGQALATASEQVTLESGESTQVTLSTTLAAEVTGAYEATVETADEAETVELALPGGSDPTALFDVESVDVPETVDAGSALTVAYEVTNTGEAAGTQEVTLLVDGTVLASEAVSLEAGDSVSDTFSYDTTSADAGGSLTLEVTTGDDSASAAVEVLEAPDPPDPEGDLVASLSSEQATVGETVSVDLNVVSVDGSGDEFGSYTFVFTYDDSVLEFQGLTPGVVGSPAAVNSQDNVVAVSAFNPSGATPAEPALSLEFEVVGSGTATVQFDNNVAGIPGDNQINNPVGDTYDTVFEDGVVEVT
jgi:hypothetical protein